MIHDTRYIFQDHGQYVILIYFSNLILKADDKNGHILPTGQWYAPSAVINDALIMLEYARVC